MASSPLPPPPISTKRKAITDYFKSTTTEPTPKRIKHNETIKQETSLTISPPPIPILQIPTPPPDTLTPQTLPVPGLTIIPNFISPSEEVSILSFLSTQPWRTDLSRRTLHYGGTFCTMNSSKIHQAPPIPTALSFLISRMTSQDIYSSSTTPPEYCIVNEYLDNQGISAHTENFSFGEPVCGLSMVDTGSIRFIEMKKEYDGSVRSGKAAKAEKTGRVVDVELPGRSLLIMRGESRYKWQHEILRSKKGRWEEWRRVSLTFRVKDGKDKKGRKKV